jgi:hypothetical protein
MSMSVSRAGGIAELGAYWRSLAGGCTPARAQIEPAAIIPLLPYIYLTELSTDPFRVYFRLSGTATDIWNGITLQGRYLDEFLDGDKFGANRHVIDCYQIAARTGQPVIDHYIWPSRSGLRTDIKFGIFPLTVDGRITRAIAIEEFDPLAISDSWVEME